MRENEPCRAFGIPRVDVPTQIGGQILKRTLQITELREHIRASGAQHPKFRLVRHRQVAGPGTGGDEERTFGTERNQTPCEPAQAHGDGSGHQELPTGKDRPQQVFVVSAGFFGQGGGVVDHVWLLA